MKYNTAWWRGWTDQPFTTTCPFDNPGEAKMWRAGWLYRNVHGWEAPEGT